MPPADDYLTEEQIKKLKHHPEDYRYYETQKKTFLATKGLYCTYFKCTESTSNLRCPAKKREYSNGTIKYREFHNHEPQIVSKTSKKSTGKRSYNKREKPVLLDKVPTKKSKQEEIEEEIEEESGFVFPQKQPKTFEELLCRDASINSQQFKTLDFQPFRLAASGVYNSNLFVDVQTKATQENFENGFDIPPWMDVNSRDFQFDFFE